MKKGLGMAKEVRTRTIQIPTFGPHHLRTASGYSYTLSSDARLTRSGSLPS
jgi:hypothetical protein